MAVNNGLFFHSNKVNNEKWKPPLHLLYLHTLQFVFVVSQYLTFEWVL